MKTQLRKNHQIPLLDLTKEKDLLKITSNFFFIKIYETELPGQGLLRDIHPACEYNEYSFQQHSIVVHLKPEQNSLRRMGDCLEIENVNVGDVAIIPAQVNHWQRIETEVAEGILLTIEPQILSRIADKTMNRDQVELLPTFAQPDPLIQNITLNLHSHLESGNYERLYGQALFHALSMHLLMHYCAFKPKLKQYQGGLSRDRLRTTIDYIQAHIDKRLTLDAIARQLNISQYHFCDLFKQSMGITPYKYILQQRIERAKQLLKKDQEQAIAEIALECGFANQTHFHKHFRKYTGMTPKAYRQS
ncbi:MAG: helix-turn-helix domain-containing protein [Waterburya sp.]